MDAYDVSFKIRQLWAENYDMNSGMLMKGDGGMPVTIEGKRVVDVVYNNGQIELRVQND